MRLFFFHLFACIGFATSLALAQGTPIDVIGSGNITMENCRLINSPGVDFGAVLYGDELVYLTRPRRGSLDEETRETYFRLFNSRLDFRGLPGRGRRFSTTLSDNFNEGPVSFTQEDQVIYFTRTLQKAGGTVESDIGTANLGLFSAYHDGYDWTAIRPLPHNDPNFTNQHPSVTEDGRRIFFASNRPGGFGGYDLYFADYRNGAWGAAINLGPEINTEGSEAFPYIHPSGRLFFTSNGHPGQGGQDVFSIDVSQRVWGQLINLPDPINSPYDDISFSIDKEGRRGYLSTNRPGGAGEDDIYKVFLRNGFESLEGASRTRRDLNVYDAESSKRISGARVWVEKLTANGRIPADNGGYSVRTQNGKKSILQTRLPPGHFRTKAAGTTDRNGNYSYTFSPRDRYYVIITMPGYDFVGFEYEHNPDDVRGVLDIALQPAKCIEVAGRVIDRGGNGVANTNIKYGLSETPEKVVAESTSDGGGYYSICLPPGENYLVTVAAGQIRSQTTPLSTLDYGASGLPQHVLTLAGALPGGTVSNEFEEAILDLPEIEYPYFSANPIPDRSPDLDVLRNFLLDYPALKIVLIVHADGPNTPEKLQRLTEERAVRLKLHLTKSGIDGSRIRTIAYGNTQQLKPCDPCTAEEHRANTRIEGKVISW